MVFAEPSHIRMGPPRPGELLTGLLPGDQLLMVNGRSVGEMTREELLAVIQNSGVSVTLVVKTVPELAEFCNQRNAMGVGDEIQLAKSPSLHPEVALRMRIHHCRQSFAGD